MHFENDEILIYEYALEDLKKLKSFADIIRVVTSDNFHVGYIYGSINCIDLYLSTCLGYDPEFSKRRLKRIYDDLLYVRDNAEIDKGVFRIVR